MTSVQIQQLLQQFDLGHKKRRGMTFDAAKLVQREFWLQMMGL